MSASIFLKAFNNHFDEFVADIRSVFPDNKDILTAQNALTVLRKGNPNILIGMWNQHIVTKYLEQIRASDINFFIHNDYSEDVQSAENANQIMMVIDKFRQPIADMEAEDQSKCMTYIQNLTELTMKYLDAKGKR
jgi:hypothetical protein